MAAMAAGVCNTSISNLIHQKKKQSVMKTAKRKAAQSKQNGGGSGEKLKASAAKQ